jgi:hypothetical protein
MDKLKIDIKRIDDDLKTLEDEINKEPKSTNFNLNNIYDILTDKKYTFFDNLTLKELNICYKHFLNELIEYEKSFENKLYKIIKHSIIVPLSKIIDIKYDENNENLIKKTEELILMTDEIKNIELIDNYFYEKIIQNIQVYYEQIETRCKEREIEGEFINRSLYGMRKNLAEITKKFNRYALFQKIPIFNSPCLEYYCNSELYNCFRLSKNKSVDTSETILFDTIKGIISEIDLEIIIFGILNISTDVNDPPTMPYIDLTLLKRIRDELNTNDQFNDDHNIITTKIAEIKEENVKIFSNIEKFNNSISETLMTQLKDARTKLEETTVDLRQKYELLNNLIQILEEINSTSLLGTLDFLHSMKNSLQTDLSCNINILEKVKYESAKVYLHNYVNIRNTDESISKVLIRQFEGGGNNTKEYLIKEYKKLIKMYKNVNHS